MNAKPSPGASAARPAVATQKSSMQEREQASAFLYDLLRLMVAKDGSDLFLTVDFPPAFKISGKMVPVSDTASRIVRFEQGQVITIRQ